MTRLPARAGAIALALVACLAAAVGAQAQPYPAKPVRLVVPYPPGGGTDILARHLAQKLGDSWSQQVLVENKPGANGMIGSEQVARSAPDGYTLVMVVATHVINPAVYQKVPYDTQRDFTPITLYATSPFVLVVHPHLGAKSVADVIALAKTKPGQLSFGSSEYSSRLAGELFARRPT
jgi:tripartite-type tricarboxylate transporter receptor subunit TctC